MAGNLSTILGGVESTLQPALDSVGGLSSIPIIGNSLGSAVQVVQQFETNLNNAVQTLANNTLPTDSQIQEAFMKTLGPSGGLNILQPLYYNQVAQISQSNPAVGTGTLTLTNGSTDVTFSQAQNLNNGDYIRLDSDGTWVQIASGSGTDYTLQSAYSGTGGTGAWSQATLGNGTAGSGTVSVDSGSSTITFATTHTLASGENLQFDSDGTWYQIASGGTGTSFTLTSDFNGTPDDSASWSSIAPSPVYVNVTHPDNLSDGTSKGVEVEMRLVDTVSVTAPLNFNTGLSSLPISITTNGSVQLTAGFAFELALTYNANNNAVKIDDSKLLSDTFNDSPATPITPLTIGSGTITLTNGSNNVTFSTAQNLATGDSVRLDADGTWYQIASGSGTSYVLTSAYAGTTGTGAWATIAAKPVNLSAADTKHEMAVFVTATLPEGFSATATIGFLQGTLTDIGNPGSSSYVASDPKTHTELDALFTLDNLGGTITGEAQPTVALSGLADANLQLQGGFGNTTLFPSISADFHLDWSFDTNSPIQSPSVSFDNVGLDLGSFVSNLLAPILSDIQSVVNTQPLLDIQKILGTPIPGLSDLSKLLGQGNITLMSLIQVVASQTGYGPLADLIAKISQVVSDVQNLQIGPNIILPLGGFDLNSDNLLSAPAALDPTDPNNLNVPDLTNPTTLVPDDAGNFNLNNAISSLGSQLPAAATQTLNELVAGIEGALNNGFDLEFPILNNPAQTVFGLLLGQDSDLVTLTARCTRRPMRARCPRSPSAAKA